MSFVVQPYHKSNSLSLSHLKRNRSTGETISRLALQSSNIYYALTGKVPELRTPTKSLRYTRRNNRYMKSSSLYSRKNKYQTCRDKKSNTARPTTSGPSGRMNNYLYPQHHIDNENYMSTSTGRWYLSDQY